MNRIEIIQTYINKYGYTKYLEIGVRDGSCFNVIKCDYKVGVDPDLSSKATIFKTSDDFFDTNTDKFNIVFIDGLHHAETIIRDISNSLDILEEGGTIVMHDCLPTSEFMQLIPLTTQDEWTGDTWRAFLKYRMNRADLSMFVVDTDYGCGVIRRGFQKPVKIDGQINYENFEKNKKEWMNVISVDEFINRIKNN